MKVECRTYILICLCPAPNDFFVEHLIANVVAALPIKNIFEFLIKLVYVFISMSNLSTQD